MGKLFDWILGMFGLIRISAMNSELSRCAEDLQIAIEALESEETSHENTLKERDLYHDWADKLAYGIGSIEEIGEHSNMNNPWANALEIIESE